MSRHEQLWAPWRLAYILGESGAPESKDSNLNPNPDPAPELKYLAGADPSCFMCRAVAEANDARNLLVERSELSLVILNRYPYNSGHLLVAPLTHQGRLDELADHQQLDLQQLIAKYIGKLERLLGAEGFNIGLNLGRIAGAGVPGHLHWHIVPRWAADTNFMPALAAIRVIPQSLEALWQLLLDDTRES